MLSLPPYSTFVFMYIIDDGNPIWVTNSDRPRQQHTTAILAVHIMLSAVYSTIGIAFDI